MGDRVAVMKDGVLQQCDTPRVLYDDPVNAFVAGFIGSPPMNLLAARLLPDGIEVGDAVIHKPGGLALPAGSDVTVGVRPEAITIGGDGIPAVVTLVEELGAEAFIHTALIAEGQQDNGAPQTAVARLAPHLAPSKGEQIGLQVKPSGVLLFDSSTGERIRT